MLTKNIGAIDRLFRIAVGAGLIAAALSGGLRSSTLRGQKQRFFADFGGQSLVFSRSWHRGA
jgi:hypothetical protein